jgi:tetratricopeptide (TPR) repeat protein
MHMKGHSDAAKAALDRSLAIAEDSGDVVNRVAVLGMMTMFHSRSGDFKAALHYAELSRAAAESSDAPAAKALAHSILGRSLHFVGDLSGAHAELEAALQQWRSLRNTGYLGLDWKNWTGICISWTLWQRGCPEQAAGRILEAVKDARRRNNPTSLAIALSWAPLIFLWSGDLRRAEEHADWLISHAESHSLGPYVAVGRSYKGALAIRQGEARSGVETLEAGLAKLHAARFEVLIREFKLALVQGFAAVGRFDEALALVDETMRLVEAHGDHFYMPEALRVKGSVLVQLPQPRGDEAEMCFTQSLTLSRNRGARAWELRAATDLAALLKSWRRGKDALALLQPVFDQFTEGGDTADVKAAERLLASLG